MDRSIGVVAIVSDDRSLMRFAAMPHVERSWYSHTKPPSVRQLPSRAATAIEATAVAPLEAAQEFHKSSRRGGLYSALERGSRALTRHKGR